MSQGTGSLFSSQDELAVNAKASFVPVKADAIRAFVEAQPDVRGAVEIADVRTLTDGAGASNGITFVTCRFGDNSRDLVVRYNPGVSLLKQKSYADEFYTMQVARSAGLPVPEVLWLDANGEYLGTPGYIAERVEGEAPPSSLFTKGLLAEANAEDRRSMMMAAAEAHGTLRGLRILPHQAPHLQHRGVGATAIERELSWWLKEAELSGPETKKWEEYRAAFSWLCGHQPKTYAPQLVHGDSQFANVMFKDRRVSAMLDWELSFLGQGESDLSLLIFLTKMLNPNNLPGVPSENEFILCYEKTSGFSLDNWEYFQAFHLFKHQGANLLTSRYNPAAEEMWDLCQDYLREALKKAGSH